jgi:pimeloyl-ACP methyl ester carboxylesterase
MRYHSVLLCVALVVAAMTTAIASDAETPSTDDDGIAVLRSRIESASDCDNPYTVYRPRGASMTPLVMIVPGFMRDQDRMRGWANELAQRGFVTATMDFCRPTAFDGRHAENARDMIALREALGAAQVVYVGHSAGGLAALLAASDDPAARGMVLLDAVDFADLGRDAAARNRVPGVALLATPGACNLRRNIRHALDRMPHVTVIPIDIATHCDFEWPPDGLCRAMCDFGGPGREQRVAAEQQIRTLAVDFIESLRTVRSPNPPNRACDGSQREQ